MNNPAPPPLPSTPERPCRTLKRSDVAYRWNISIPTIKRREKSDSNFPRPIRIGSRAIRYCEADIIAYEQKLRNH